MLRTTMREGVQQNRIGRARGRCLTMQWPVYLLEKAVGAVEKAALLGPGKG